MAVCAAAVQRTLEPYCDSCGERVTANLLNWPDEAEGWRGESLKTEVKRRNKRRGSSDVCVLVPDAVRCYRPDVCGCAFTYVRFVFAGQIFNPDGEEIWDTLHRPGTK